MSTTNECFVVLLIVRVRQRDGACIEKFALRSTQHSVRRCTSVVYCLCSAFASRASRASRAAPPSSTVCESASCPSVCESVYRASAGLARFMGYDESSLESGAAEFMYPGGENCAGLAFVGSLQVQLLY